MGQGRRRDDAVLGVARHEDAHLVARFDLRRHLARWQEHFAELPGVEVKTVIRFTENDQGTNAAEK